MTRLIIGAGLSAVFFATAIAQQRSPNPGTQPVLRQWPDSGIWGVALIRLADGPLGCWFATGHGDQKSGERYIWGLRWRSDTLAAMVIDNNQPAIAGPSIQIVIDGVPLGTYQIERRSDGGNGFQIVLAELPYGDSIRLLALVRVGGTMQFITAAATYSGSLQGAQQALANLNACKIEVAHLSGGTGGPNGAPKR